MLTASFCRKTLLILLVMLLVAPGLSAAGQQPEHGQSVKLTQWASLEFFSRFLRYLQTVQAKAGCNIDPSGCTVQSPPLQTKAGCEIDPSGRCIS